jgi:hypothetical protein
MRLTSIRDFCRNLEEDVVDNVTLLTGHCESYVLFKVPAGKGESLRK